MDRQKGPIPFDPVPVDAFMALKARGITQETCEHFGYGIGKVGGKYCHIAPLYDHEGILVAQHLRFEGKEFRWRGSASGLVEPGEISEPITLAEPLAAGRQEGHRHRRRNRLPLHQPASRQQMARGQPAQRRKLRGQIHPGQR